MNLEEVNRIVADIKAQAIEASHNSFIDLERRVSDAIQDAIALAAKEIAEASDGRRLLKSEVEEILKKHFY